MKHWSVKEIINVHPIYACARIRSTRMRWSRMTLGKLQKYLHDLQPRHGKTSRGRPRKSRMKTVFDDIQMTTNKNDLVTWPKGDGCWCTVKWSGFAGTMFMLYKGMTLRSAAWHSATTNIQDGGLIYTMLVKFTTIVFRFSSIRHLNVYKEELYVLTTNKTLLSKIT